MKKTGYQMCRHLEEKKFMEEGRFTSKFFVRHPYKIVDKKHNTISCTINIYSSGETMEDSITKMADYVDSLVMETMNQEKNSAKRRKKNDD